MAFLAGGAAIAEGKMNTERSCHWRLAKIQSRASMIELKLDEYWI